MNHQDAVENIPAYVLGALDPEETAAVEEHLRGCEECQGELASYGPLEYALDLSAPDAPLPEDAMDRLLERARPVRSLDDAPRRRDRRRPARRLLLPAVAVLLLVAVGLTAVFYAAGQGPPGLGEEEQIAFVGAPEGVSTDAAVVAHTWGTEVQLEIEGLQDGEVYEVTLERNGGRPVEAGTFIGVEAEPIECRLNGAVLRQDVRAVSVADSAGAVVMRSEIAPRPDLASVSP